ncbi:MAG: P-II family nitrogen regulator [Nitriliruptorales bacterium]
MRLVTAFVQPHEIEAVQEVLREVGVAGMTVSEVQGVDGRRAQTETYRGAEYEVESAPELRVEVLCFEARVDEILDALQDAAASGEVGDAKVVVTPVETVVRIRTGEQGPYAL